MEEHFYTDKFLKHSLENYSVQPGIASFDKVLQKMQKEKRRRIIFFFWFSGLISLSILGLIVSKQFLKEQSSDHSATKISAEPISVVTDASKKISLQKVSDKPKNIKSVAPIVQIKSPVKLHGPINTKKQNSYLTQREKSSLLAGAVNVPAITGSRILTERPPISDSIISDDLVHEQVNYLPRKNLFLPESVRKDSIDFELQVYSNNLSGAKIRNRPVFFIGAAYDPQLTSMLFQKNKNTFDPKYNSKYLKDRKEENSVRFNYAYGIRAGLIIKDKWELTAGFGRERIAYKDEATGVIASVYNSLSATKSTDEVSSRSYLIYNSYNLQVARFFDLNPFTRIKFAGGLWMNQLKQQSGFKLSSATFAYVAGWNTIADLKVGLVENIGRHFQLQFNPHIFFSPNSMLNKSFILHQRLVGAGLECQLVYLFR